MLIRMPGARDYIETGRVSRIGLEDGYVKAMDGQDKMLARNFNSSEEADAWADEVAKIVNEANAPRTSSDDSPSTLADGKIWWHDCVWQRLTGVRPVELAGGGGGSSHESTWPGPSGASPVPCFADWRPTLEQIKEAGREFESLPPVALIDPLCMCQMRSALRIWQRIYAAQVKGTA